MGYSDEEKQREYQKNWRRRHAAEQNDLRRTRRMAVKTMVDGLKDKCSRCGYDKCKAALEFHHRDANIKEVSLALAVHNQWNRERVMKEIEKCDLLCANCHREEEHPDER